MSKQQVWHIVSYSGDYSCHNQPFWTREYTDYAQAEADAMIQHITMLKRKEWKPSVKRPMFYTVVQDEDGEVIPFLITQDGRVFRGSEAKKQCDEFCEAAQQ